MSSSLEKENNLFDLGTLNQSTIPDLSLSSVHQPRLSLELGPTDLSVSLQDIQTPAQSSSKQPSSSSSDSSNSERPHTNQLALDLTRNSSKRWTSFSELGKSVLKLKSFERSTVHGGSNPYLRHRLVPIKSNSICAPSSGSTNHRNLFKLFNQDQPTTISSNPAGSSSLVLPILPPMSELLDGTTSFDKELCAMADDALVVEEHDLVPDMMIDSKSQLYPQLGLVRSPSHTKSASNVPTGLVEFQARRAQSVVSSQSAPVITFAPPSSLSQAMTEAPAEPTGGPPADALPERPSPSLSVLTVDEPGTKSIDQDAVSKLPSTEEQPALKADEPPSEPAEDAQEPVIEILNRSDEGKSEDPTQLPTKPSSSLPPPPPASPAPRTGAGIRGFKKKNNDGAGLFKLLFLKSFGHFKSSASSHNDGPKTLATH